jgi:hypothetical protein
VCSQGKPASAEPVRTGEPYQVRGAARAAWGLSRAKTSALVASVRALPAPNCLVVELGSWSAPLMMARLASIVHDGQGAARRQQHHCHDDHKWGDFHCGLGTAVAHTPRMHYRSCSEPEMNGLFARSPRLQRPEAGGRTGFRSVLEPLHARPVDRITTPMSKVPVTEWACWKRSQRDRVVVINCGSMTPTASLRLPPAARAWTRQ